MLRRRTSAGSRPRRARHQVDGPLHREGGFRPAGAAIGRVRHLVGDDDPARGRQVLDLVGAGQVDGGVVGDAGPDRVPGAAIDDVVVADREDMAVIVKADLDIVPLVARMGRAHQVLAALLDPAHRPAEPAREERDQQVLGVDMALAAKAAADIERDAAHPRLGQAEQRGGLAPHPMHHLGRGPDRRRVGARIVGADDAAALHRHGGVAVVIEAALQPMRRARPARRRRRRVPTENAPIRLVSKRSWTIGLSGRNAASGSTTAGSSSRSSVTSSAASSAWSRRLRDDDRDRLADMPHLVMRQ